MGKEPGQANIYLNEMTKLWLLELEKKAKDFSDYLNKANIMPSTMLSPDQSIAVLKKIEQIYSLIVRVSEAKRYASKHPELFSPEAHQTFKKIKEKSDLISSNVIGNLEERAVAVLQHYQMLRIEKPLGEEGLLITSKQSRKSRQSLDDDIRKQRVRVSLAKRLKEWRDAKQKFQKGVNAILDIYKDVDEEVKQAVNRKADEHYRVLRENNEGSLAWVQLWESGMRLADERLGKVFTALDVHEDRKAQLYYNTTRGLAAIALGSVLPLDKFMDTALHGFNLILDKFTDDFANFNVSENDRSVMFFVLGLAKTSSHDEYVKALTKIKDETVYQRIERFKKFYEKKLSTLGHAYQACSMMSSSHQYWGQHTAAEVVAAQRMKVIDGARFNDPEFSLNELAVREDLIRQTSAPFQQFVEDVFVPLEEEYGDRQEIRQIYETIHKLQFDSTKSGPDSHNREGDHTLTDGMANLIELHMLLKYAVSEIGFWGAKSYKAQQAPKHFTPSDEDNNFGLYNRDHASKRLLSEILVRIHKSKNEALKEKLGLCDSKQEDELEDVERMHDKSKGIWSKITNRDGKTSDNTKQKEISKTIKSNKLHQAKHTELSKYRCIKGLNKIPGVNIEFDYTHNQHERREMIQLIIDEYYNKDLEQLMREHIQIVAEEKGLPLPTPRVPKGDDNENHAWISDDDLNEMISAFKQPFIQDTRSYKSKKSRYVEHGMRALSNRALLHTCEKKMKEEHQAAHSPSPHKIVKFRV